MRVLMLLSMASSLCCSIAAEAPKDVPPMTMSPPTRWSPIAWAEGPQPRRFATVTPSPVGFILFGGLSPTGELADPWRWDGARWNPLGARGAPTPRTGHGAVWVGERLCVWGGARSRRCVGDGACWDPRSNEWRAITPEGAPSARRRHGAVAVGGRMMVFGGLDAEGEALNDGALYDPAEDRWEALADGAPRPRADPWMIESHGRVAVVGGVGEALALGGDDGAWYEVEARRWIEMPTGEGPLAREGAMVARGADALIAVGERVWRFSAQDGVWRPSHADGAPARRWSAAVAAVPGGVAVWGGIDGARALSDGARYDLATDRWIPLPAQPAMTPRSDATAFFDGARLLVLWGADGARLLTDAWTIELGPAG